MKTKNNLLKDGYYFTDGGLETTLIFHEGIQLQQFAAFELLKDSEGREILMKYYKKYLDLALRFDTGFILDTPTWRASAGWGFKLGYTTAEIDEINKNAVQLLHALQSQPSYSQLQMLVSGAIGPMGDGYQVSNRIKPGDSRNYHTSQIEALAAAGVDLVTAYTMNYSDEAIGIVLAAGSIDIPVAISFTVETDGQLPDGEKLGEAIEKTDEETAGYASYYMINCAHPDHFKSILEPDSKWKNRIWGIRANASCKSHKELDESETLDAGDRHKLAAGYSELLQLLPNLRIIGGCCGTDHTHLQEIGKALFERGTVSKEPKWN